MNHIMDPIYSAVKAITILTTDPSASSLHYWGTKEGITLLIEFPNGTGEDLAFYNWDKNEVTYSETLAQSFLSLVVSWATLCDECRAKRIDVEQKAADNGNH